MHNDGGSIQCNGCGQKYHKCKNGLDRYGSPGPLLCEVCNTKIIDRKLSDQYIQLVHCDIQNIHVS
jgi:hypothetical protein